MIYRIDGDQMMIAASTFVNLVESPFTFIPLDGDLAKAILAEDAPDPEFAEFVELLHKAYGPEHHWSIDRDGVCVFGGSKDGERRFVSVTNAVKFLRVLAPLKGA